MTLKIENQIQHKQKYSQLNEMMTATKKWLKNRTINVTRNPLCRVMNSIGHHGMDNFGLIHDHIVEKHPKTNY